MLDFLKKTEEIKENYWALLIEPEWISSAIWQITDGKVEIISTSLATRWDPSDNEAIDDLIEQIDTSLSSCSQNLPEDFPDPTKTVFGVPNSWLQDGNIKEKYLAKLKKICEDLSLVPSGFVVLSEAISHFIKQEEETALSGIVVGISSGSFDISIFNVGKLLGTTSVLRSVSVEEDIVEGVSRLSLTQENLPSRIILYNQKEQELEEIKNSLNEIDWNKLKFIHPPKIEILEPNKKILAVALAGGSELGEVSGVVNNVNNLSVDTITEGIPIEETSNVEEPEGITAEDLGFIVKPNASSTVEEAVYVPQISKPSIMPKFSFKKPQFKLPKLNLAFGSKSIIMISSLILTLIFLGFALWWLLPKATITIFVSPKKLDENISLEIGKDIKKEEVSVNVKQEKTNSTTGTKTVGDKAKGSVKVQNGTAFPISLPLGTVLISASDLKFVTTKSSSVSGALSPSSPGTATIDVEAGSIGGEFNLAKDEIFKVSNFPKAEVDATSIDTFTGGSSRQISSVSEDDRKKIIKDLKSEMLKKAKDEILSKISDDLLLIDSAIVEEVEEENYSNKIGDEATNLKLSLEIKYTSTIVSKNELSAISKKSLNDKIPSGFILRDDQITYDFGEASNDGKFDVKILVNLLPSIDPIEVAKQIAGKYPSLAEGYLANIPGFVRAEVRLKPTLIGKLGTLPHISKNITVLISAEK